MAQGYPLIELKINAAMEEAVPEAWAAIALSHQTTAPEKVYIPALARRYSPAPFGDRFFILNPLL